MPSLFYTLKSIGQDIIIHYEAISDIRHLFIGDDESQMVVDCQSVVIVLIAGQPDFFKTAVFTKFNQEIQRLCRQMLAAAVFFYVELA